ncbi:helix-turn-helix domain-containing protein [Acrocarpospora corrugata]
MSRDAADPAVSLRDVELGVGTRGARLSEPSAIEDLATYLRQLKDKTGRSYDALARRLGVGKSTLHRYCSGEGVPPRFTLLEQFAKECRASQAEVIELHQRWVRAQTVQAPEPETGADQPVERPEGRETAPDQPLPRRRTPRPRRENRASLRRSCPRDARGRRWRGWRPWSRAQS